MTGLQRQQLRQETIALARNEDRSKDDFRVIGGVECSINKHRFNWLRIEESPLLDIDLSDISCAAVELTGFRVEAVTALWVLSANLDPHDSDGDALASRAAFIEKAKPLLSDPIAFESVCRGLCELIRDWRDTRGE